MVKKEMIAMLLADCRGSSLGVLTAKTARSAVAFGGKYRIIDFPLSNCINSGIDTVGVLTQYKPHRLIAHIGIGIPWDLDRNEGGVAILPLKEKTEKEGYTGTANAICQNLAYMESFNPDYVLIMPGDNIYKMDYEVMLDFHKAHNADVSIAVMPLPQKENSRFGVVVADKNDHVLEFQENPAEPGNNFASMGIYIFSWKALVDALVSVAGQSRCDIGRDILPYCHKKGETVIAYQFNGYWKDVDTLGAYWEANMGLVDIIPELNLYEEFWKIYTRNDTLSPQFVSPDAVTLRCLIGEGCEICGEVYNSVIGCGVIIEKGAVVRDSVIMQNSVIKAGAEINRSIIAENVTVGENVKMGVGDEVPNRLEPSIYSFGLAVAGEDSKIPGNVIIGKNTAITGKTSQEDYPDGMLQGGEILDREAGGAP